MKILGATLAHMTPMSSLDNIYLKMSPSLEPAVFNQMPIKPVQLDCERQISREIAHELNNILTIVRGYADRMLMKHGQNPELRSELQLISDNARRAELVVRQAAKPHGMPTDLIG